MKRCPTCNRVETDEALAFCRVDGTRLISESGVRWSKNRRSHFRLRLFARRQAACPLTRISDVILNQQFQTMSINADTKLGRYEIRLGLELRGNASLFSSFL